MVMLGTMLQSASWYVAMDRVCEDATREKMRISATYVLNRSICDYCDCRKMAVGIDCNNNNVEAKGLDKEHIRGNNLFV